VVALVGLELALQVLAFAASLLVAPVPATAVPDGARVVVCVGDSFTFGLGATAPDASYPAVLEARLRSEQDAAWVTVNRGYPGRNSREAVIALQRALTTMQPEFVCIVVGVNDAWSRPDRLDRAAVETVADAAAEPGFRWEWRTLRLLRTARQWNPWGAGEPAPESGVVEPGIVEPGVVEPPAEDPSAPVETRPGGDRPTATVSGHWRSVDGVVDLHLLRSGALELGALTGRWQPGALAGQLELRFDGMPAVFVVDVAPDGSTLSGVIAGGVEVVLKRVRAGTLAVEAARALLRRREYDEAEVALRSVLAGHVDEPRIEALARAGLAEVAMHRGNVDSAARHADRLRELHERAADPEVTAACLHGLLRARQRAAALAMAREAVAVAPDFAAGWLTIATVTLDTGELRAAREAVARWLELMPANSPGRPHVLRLRAFAWGGEDPALASESALGALLGMRDERAARHAVGTLRRYLPPARLAAAFDSLGVDAADRARVQRLLGPSDAAVSAGVQETLRHHLRLLVELCREVGAEPVFGSYPRGASDAVRAVATELGVTLLPVHERFERARREQPAAAFFVADGHCNDRGYALMAEVFAEHITARSR